MPFDKKTLKQLALLIAGGVALHALFQNFSAFKGLVVFLWRMMLPFILGGCMAFIFNVPMRNLEKLLFGRARGKLAKAGRPISLVLTFILIFGVITLLIVLIVPEVQRSTDVLISSVPAFGRRVAAWATSLAERFPEVGQWLSELDFNWQGLVTGALDAVKNAGTLIFNSTVGAAGSIVNGVVSFFIAFVFSIYILLQKEKLLRQSKILLYTFLPEKRVPPILDIFRLADKTFSRFLSGQCMEAVILGLMFFITMSILRFPYATLVGALIALTALIPIVGAFIGCIVGAFLILIVDPVRALWFIILFLVLQRIEGNLIYPHVVGSSVGLPSIWVLLAVTVGGSLMGIAGMLIFIPLCSVGYILLRSYCYRRLRERKIPPARWKT